MREAEMREAVARAVSTALEPVLQRLAALEEHSHPPVDLLPVIREEIAALIAVETPVNRRELDIQLMESVSKGLSLRQTAKRHRVGVGRVRGAIARSAIRASMKES